MNRFVNTALFSSCLAIMFSTNVLAEDYDIVINNGRVMDPETRLDAVFALS